MAERSARAKRGGYTAAARLAGRRRAAALEGLDLALGELDAIVDAIGPQLNALVRRAGSMAQDDAQSRAVFGKSGRYREGIRLKVFEEPDGGVTSKVFVVPPYYPERTQYGGKMPSEFPIWVEYGTYKWAGKPHLIPALEKARAWLNSEVESLLRATEARNR
jgi:hypothetical protein